LKEYLKEKTGKFEVKCNKEKMYLNITPTQISLTKYKLFFFPVKVFVFKLRNVKIKINQDSNEIVVYDGEFQEYTLKSKELVVVYGLFKTFLFSKIGGSFEEKNLYFRKQLLYLCDVNTSKDKLITISRENLLKNSVEILKNFNEDWKKKWIIHFKNEPGIDQGGLLKEFIQIFSKELFQTSGLFVVNEKQKLSFNHKCEQFELYELAGKFLGKCIFEKKLIGVPFSHIFFKHLIGLPFNYFDFEIEDPTLFKTKIKFILDSNMDDPDTREALDDLTFSEEEYSNNKATIFDLKKDGRKILVSNKNKQEYLYLLTKFRFITRVQKQINNFMKGLHSILPVDWLNIFDENELEILICGLSEISVEDWMSNTEYQGGIDSKIKKWFWIAIDNLNQEERAKLLQFITSSTQVPSGGFKYFNPKIRIQKINSTDSLPRSHTCTNTLDLPNYSSYEKLMESIMIALNYGNEGFGFA
jgi:apoptosis-resistant E3 ubiquitin protein ligase 1